MALENDSREKLKKAILEVVTEKGYKKASTKKLPNALI